MNIKEFLIGAGLLIFCLLFFSFRTGELGYSIPDEKRYIQSVKEMVLGGDWITPHYHGRKRFEKPILFYWSGALSSKVLGLNLYGARFPSILFGGLTVLVVYLLGLELFERGVGLVSGLLLATSGMFYAYSRFATPDMALIFFITLSVYFFIKGYKNLDKPKDPFFLLFFCSMGLATLAKGPIGPILIILIAAVFIISYGNFAGVIKKMRVGIGVLIFLAVVLPWFVAMIKIHGSEYLNYIWKVETLQRVSGTNLSDLVKIVFRYILVIIVGNLAMSLFLPSAIFETTRPFKFWYGISKEIPTTENRTLKLSPKAIFLKDRKSNIFLLGWLILVFLFFTFVGTKKGHYMLALSPVLALVIGKAIFYKKEDVYNDILFKIPLLVMIVAYTLGLAGIMLITNYMLDAIPLAYYLVIAAPVVLIWGWIKKRNFAALFVISNVILAIFIMGLAIPTLDNKPLLRFAGIIESEFKENNIVGVGSHVISHNRLSRYLDKKVKKVNVDLSGQELYVRRNKELLVQFLTKKERVFCVVTKTDYLTYVPQSIKKGLYILDREHKWKKTNKIKFDLDLLFYFLCGKKDSFMDRVREEILLVTNHPPSRIGRTR